MLDTNTSYIGMRWCRQATYILYAPSMVWPFWLLCTAAFHSWMRHMNTSVNRSTSWGQSTTLFGSRGPCTGGPTHYSMDLDSPQTPNFSGLKDFPGIKLSGPPRVRLCNAKDELPVLREKEEYRDSGIFFSSVDSTPEPREADANFLDIGSDSTEGSESVISVGDGKEVLCSPDLDFDSDKDPAWKMQSFFIPHKPDKLCLDSLSAGPPLLDLTMLMMQPVRSTPHPPKAQRIKVLPPDLLNTISSVVREKIEAGEEISTWPTEDETSSILMDHETAVLELNQENLTECDQMPQDENNILGIDIFDDEVQATDAPKLKKRAKKRKSGSSSGNKSSKKEKKAVPNYFVAVQITNPEIHTHVQTVQSHVEAVSPCLRAAFVPPPTLHLTMHVSHLPDNDHISRAKAALDECLEQVTSLWPTAHAPLLHVAGLGSFRDNIIFVNIEKDSSLDILNKVADIVHDCLLEKGIPSTDARGFKPHITFMKLSKALRLRHKGIKKIDSTLYEAFRECDFGWQRVRGLQLCSMHKTKDDHGYYHVEHEVTFDLPEGEALDGSAGRIANFQPKPVAAMSVKAVVKLEKDLKWTFTAPPEHS